MHLSVASPMRMSTNQWMTLTLWFVSATAATVIFLYVNFVSQATLEDYRQHQIQVNQNLEKRLERIEDKLDQLLTNSGKSH